MAAGSGRGRAPIPPVPHSQSQALLGPRRLRRARPAPGIVVEWQQRDGAWFALVAYVIEDEQVLVQQWLPADLLTRIG